MPQVDLDFTRYYKHAELTAALRELAEAYSDLATLSSVGKSHQSRDIWLLTVTNQATGSDLDKPAFYLDDPIHAEEVAASQVVLYTAWYLLAHYGTDPLVMHLLDTRASYIFPRINPDGGEISLTTGHHWCGNGRYLPGDEFTQGLCQMDLDGNGLIVQMRVQDPHGEGKVSDKDPRLMRLREPGEVGRTYYRLYPEGTLKEWDGGRSLELSTAGPALLCRMAARCRVTPSAAKRSLRGLERRSAASTLRTAAPLSAASQHLSNFTVCMRPRPATMRH